MNAITHSQQTQSLANELSRMIERSDYPCIGAKAVVAKQQLYTFTASDIRCPDNDQAIANFLYDFVDLFRMARPTLCSAAVIFENPEVLTEEDFELYLWKRLQALADLDASNYACDLRVSGDPTAANFSFSIKAEALYVIGLHPASSRKARQFSRSAIVFNPHVQFEWLRSRGKFDAMKQSVRQRDLAYAGTINPMLSDFGVTSEAIQYSGLQHENNWKCPFNARH